MLRKWHRCRFLLNVLPSILPTVRNTTKARKSSCQVSTWNSLIIFSYDNLVCTNCCALSNIITCFHLGHTCQVRLLTVTFNIFLKDIRYMQPIKRTMFNSRLRDVYPKIFKAIVPHHLQYLIFGCWNIVYIGQLWAQHDGGKTLSKQIPEVLSWIQQLPIRARLTLFYLSLFAPWILRILKDDSSQYVCVHYGFILES